jgi:preprotein translocase subunit SecD
VIDLEAELRGGLTDAANVVPVSPDPWGDYRRRTTSPPRRRRLSVGFSVAGIVAATAAIVVVAVLLDVNHTSTNSNLVSVGPVITLTPHSELSHAQLNRSALIIQDRLRGTGIHDARVTVDGSALVATVPKGARSAVVAASKARGVLRFRQVLSLEAGVPSPGSSAELVAISGPAESPTLTHAFLTLYAEWDCSKHPNPTQGADIATDYIIACDAAQGTKDLLAPTAVEGTQVSGANSGLDNQTGTQWVVNLSFNGSGSKQWFNVTKTSYEVTNGQQSNPGSCQPPKGCNAVAIVLDGVIQSAPTIQNDGIPGGQAQITGNFTQTSAGQLADVLKYGALPLKFSASDVQSVSATLGAAQLRGGLIAGIIGLGLVVIFSLLYYRALGLVTVGSLAVSGAILYAATVLLGHSKVGYTLSLPGIAGFIVAVGITADSFVVFFERLRDEIREGRRLRSGVDRAWPRARRTILSADSVSLLAAIILYAVSIGDVRGFAFTLGLSTFSDLFIVFFFTKPLLMVLAKVPAFDSGKTWTGVGKARAGVVREPEPDRPARPPRQPRTREA